MGLRAGTGRTGTGGMGACPAGGPRDGLRAGTERTGTGNTARWRHGRYRAGGNAPGNSASKEIRNTL